MKANSTSKPRSDQASMILRQRILGGVLEPGTLLAESAVARELGVSRVPVREALFELEYEGLVKFSDTGRAYVKELSPRDFEELFDLRLTLETVGARMATPSSKAGAARLAKNIAATRKALHLADVTRLDLDFHEIILELGGNTRLLKLWRSVRSELELWLGGLQRQHQLQKLDTREQTAVAHEELVEAFLSRTPAECEQLMRQHIIAWREWLPTLPLGLGENQPDSKS